MAKQFHVDVVVNGTIQATGGVDKLKSATTVVSVAGAAAPSAGQVLTATGPTAATWQTPASITPWETLFAFMGA